MTTADRLPVPTAGEDLPRISRRRFLQAGAAGVAGLAAYAVTGGPGAADAAAGPAGSWQPSGGPAARTYPLNGDWLFGGLYSSAATSPSFDDSGFARVTVPHCVNPLGWSSWDAADWEQVWIYRRHFDAPPGWDKLRTFVDFDGVLTTATPTFNGTTLAAHPGGYLPFSYELTEHLTATANVLALEDDATWQQVPPEGSSAGASAVDYLEPGGIARNVRLRLVPQVFVADVWASPINVLDPTSRAVSVQTTIDAAVVPSGALTVTAELLDQGGVISRTSSRTTVSAVGQSTLTQQIAAPQVLLWSPNSPKLYQVRVTLSLGAEPIHDFTRRIGFRTAVFEVDGFYLNGERLKLFGLDRHQTFPYAGMSAPDRVQRHDAELLRSVLNCNMVRCSHYPQSPAFLDACDELGLMVWEETPGWQYVGGAAWQEIMLQNVKDMVLRDRSRPSVIIWGVAPNEAPRMPTLYGEAQDLANSLDGTRQTSGTQTSQSLTNWNLEVFAYDDYTTTSTGQATLRPPVAGVPYLVTEAVGALDGAPFYRWFDTQATQIEQATMHAEVHDAANSQDAYTGLLAWCGFDYDSYNGNIYEDIKWPGVCDTFRVPKPGASYYQAQQDPARAPVIQPAFYWEFGPTSPVTALGSQAPIWSNCDRLEAYVDGAHYATLTPDTTDFPNTTYPPFYLDTTGLPASVTTDPPVLRLDGYVGTQKVASRSFSGSSEGDRLAVQLNDPELAADGVDATLISFRAVDRFGAPRPYVTGDVVVTVQGPGEWVGELLNLAVTATPELIEPGQMTTVTATLTNGGFPFEGNGGVGGVLVRTIAGSPGDIQVTFSHPTLGSESVAIHSVAAPDSDPLPGSGGTAAPAGSPRFTGVSLDLAAPTGWTATAEGPTTFDSVAPSAHVTVTWTVTVPATATGAAVRSPDVAAAFTLSGQARSTSTAVPVTVEVPLASAFDNVGITANADVGAGDLDGVGNTFSAEALAALGFTPGSTFEVGGLTFTWPDVPAATPDNVLAAGQTIALSGSGTTLGFVGCGSPSNEGGSGTVHYADGTTSTYTVSLGNYFNTSTVGNTVVVTTPYINDSSPGTNGGSPQRDHTGTIYYAGVAITEGKTVAAVTLPDTYSAASGGRITAMHVFALSVG